MTANTRNIILATDSYKLNHWNQYPEGTEAVYSYFEARTGAEFPETVFFGLQYILQEYLQGSVVTQEDIEEADALCKAHFSSPFGVVDDYFNRKGWQHIVDEHNGKLPLKIKAVAEGTPVPNSNVLMTVENTCPHCFWLTNHVESLLTHVWASSTVATMSRHTKKMISEHLAKTAESDQGLPFMLHDFGYRGVSSHESAGISGAGHLVNFLGSDTVPAMLYASKFYDVPVEGVAYSVAATEHSVMTSLGPDGEIEMLKNLLHDYPSGILSVVSDSFDIYGFVRQVGARAEEIKMRNGVFVVRPDSVTPKHDTPARLVTWIAHQLDLTFGVTVNSKGYMVLDPHIRILWGDGIDYHDIDDILRALRDDGYSAENMVFGMGGGLLQKINRDTQRFAIKMSATCRNGKWYDIYKNPIGGTKPSKKGKLSLLKRDGEFTTVSNYAGDEEDQLRTVFLNGEITVRDNFNAIRERAKLS